MQIVTDSSETDIHREKGIGHSHMPYYPRLCRTIWGRTETEQITSRAAKDSRVAKQVIGPRFSQSWLNHLSGENPVVMNTVVESRVSG